jgi:ATP-dependent DNA ligase
MAGPIGVSETIDGNTTDLIRVAEEFGFEGIVAKRKNSCYESGQRSGA